MKFQILNLGHIEEATIEEKKLIVIAGDNGSGKTLLLESLDLIKKTFTKEMDTIINEASDDFSKNFTLNYDWEGIFKDYQKQKSNDTPSFISDDFTLSGTIINSSDINNFFLKNIEKTTKKVKTLIGEKILFNSNSKVDVKLLNVPKFDLKDFDIKFDFMLLNKDVFLITGIKDDIRTDSHVIFRVKSIINKKNISSLKEDEIRGLYDIVDEKEFNLRFHNSLVQLLMKMFFEPYFDGHNILFLPSERNLYMDNAISKLIGEQNENYGIRYSEFIFMTEYLKFQDTIKRFNFLQEIDEQYIPLFEGTLTFGSNGEVVGLVKEDDQEIKRTLFSTKLNRMIPYLILSNPLERYKDVIIEEPEAHLSLRSMNTLLDFFKLLLENKRLYITTHSDVFFARINNLLLKNKDISAGIYELIIEGNKSYLKEIHPNEYGYKVELFAEELEDLFDETLEIQNGEFE
ncbi:AAA family ATPase [Paenisporosarcina sp.]|uniref:AAA family ATPase n=1 Tax=Paenisporosarcina sp. TaxID=1932001 RepID=UPI003C763DDD